MILRRRPLWTVPEQKNSKVKHRPVGLKLINSYPIDFYYRVCIKSLWLYHDSFPA